MQSKKLSHLEVLSNQVVGILIGWGIVYFIFPLLKSYTQAQLATISSFIFFVASYTRSYIIRRIFNKFKENK